MSFIPVIENISLDTKKPSRNDGRAQKSTWFRKAVEKLEAGQSFFVPLSQFSSENYARVRVVIVGRELGFTMSAKKETKDNQVGLRVFRIS